MSRENVEIVRRILNHLTETQQLSDLVSPDFVWHVASWSEWAGPAEFYGREGFMEFFADWVDAYEEWTQEVESIVDAGNGQVVVTSRQRGRLQDSDAWVELLASFLFTVENGSLERAEVYATPDEALEAAGLSE